jgi:hypothetical protein
MDEVFLSKQKACSGCLSCVQERIEGVHSFDVNVGIDTTLHVEHHYAEDVGTLDARHPVVVAQIFGEVFGNELPTPLIVPEFELPVPVQSSPRL